MAKKTRARTLAEQIAELDDPAPKDFDPEDVERLESDSDGSADDESEVEADPRAHYEAVGKSKLRKPQGPAALGPQYVGKKVGREVIEEEDSDDPFAREYADSESEGESHDGSDEEDEVDLDSDEDDEGSEGDSENEDEDEDEGMSDADGPSKADEVDRDELRRLMADDAKQVAASLSQAAQADIAKGTAVKAQKATFDALLNVRIKLQKAMIATNSLPAPAPALENDAIVAAETAAITLWNRLNALRYTLSNTAGSKRSYTEFAVDTPLDALWAEMHAPAADAAKQRDATLDFWSNKVRATAAMPTRGRLNNAPATQALSAVLRAQLADLPRLVARTQVARSCAPAQAAAAAKKQPPPSTLLPVFDDADFYSTLLQALVAERGADAALGSLATQPWQAAREAKTKRGVDTKASKGRKLRYTVHEALLNFMAPEDRGVWGARQRDELFSGLFGQRGGLDEGVSEESDEEGDGLRLFAGV
ncbi:TRAUB-domain-containing protein [Trichodelitschia bisporula]|uniref:Protein BFR2 n=1 Tax=Trichodelitschia bisporula TaxID=703511 RepID=A0A6G1HRU2_9PEZI|nr:TRAUB-domain-containing protein [Trichodelitschia bisporula]